jgi:hypothetical protein
MKNVLIITRNESDVALFKKEFKHATFKIAVARGVEAIIVNSVLIMFTGNASNKDLQRVWQTFRPITYRVAGQSDRELPYRHLSIDAKWILQHLKQEYM